MAVKPRKIPQRQCVGCRTMKDKKELVRVVKTPENEIVLDVTGKKSGRGAYVCRQESCLTRAIKQKQLERQLEVRMTEEVAAALQYELAHLPAPEPEAD